MSKPVEIELVPVELLVHIEGHSKIRVEWLLAKIRTEGIWTKPLAIDDAHHLVLDGQHRMEAALRLGLARVPVVKYAYSSVTVWSLRRNYEFDWRLVTQRSLSGNPYPYKTVKHRFPSPVPSCTIPLSELSR